MSQSGNCHFCLTLSEMFGTASSQPNTFDTHLGVIHVFWQDTEQKDWANYLDFNYIRFGLIFICGKAKQKS